MTTKRYRDEDIEACLEEIEEWIMKIRDVMKERKEMPFVD